MDFEDHERNQLKNQDKENGEYFMEHEEMKNYVLPTRQLIEGQVVVDLQSKFHVITPRIKEEINLDRKQT